MCDQDTSMSDGPSYTKSQGQYPAFIYYYTKIHGQPPAERDIQLYFKVSPPAVHGMLKALQSRGFIERVPRAARSIRLTPRGTLSPPGTWTRAHCPTQFQFFHFLDNLSNETHGRARGPNPLWPSKHTHPGASYMHFFSRTGQRAVQITFRAILRFLVTDILD